MLVGLKEVFGDPLVGSLFAARLVRVAQDGIACGVAKRGSVRVLCLVRGFS